MGIEIVSFPSYKLVMFQFAMLSYCMGYVHLNWNHGSVWVALEERMTNNEPNMAEIGEHFWFPGPGSFNDKNTFWAI